MKPKNIAGITLIALVVTIVVLVILAAVSINAMIGQNGILQEAQTAGMKTEIAEIKAQIQMELVAAEIQAYSKNENVTEEQIKSILEQYGEVLYEQDGSIKGVKTEKEYEILLDEIWGGMVIDGLPENDSSTEPGTIVKLPTGWNVQTSRYISTQTGKEVTGGTKVATVYAVAIGDGISVPVPYGFYYVGGNLGSGVVISDNEQDKNKYVGQADVPSGCEYDENNNPVYTIQGNQFVWIPCTEQEYHKTEWGSAYQNHDFWERDTNGAELTQIQKYNGFYVGRFEAGLDENIPEFTTKQSAYATIYDLGGIPQSKPGKLPWCFISYNKTKENSENMYKTNYVSSGMITGTQWDVMLNKIAEKEPEKSLYDNSSWANILTNSIPFKGRVATYSAKFLSVFSEVVEKNTTPSVAELYTTGASEKAKAYNLYDVAGNVWEKTEETAYSNGMTTEDRGGGGDGTYLCIYRSGWVSKSSGAYSGGFRPVLYIK